MKLYSTIGQQAIYSVKDAVLGGLAPDGGLFMPAQINPLPQTFFDRLHDLTLPEICYHVAQTLLGEEIPEPTLRSIVEEAISFGAPVVPLRDGLHVQELFHGPSLAFKDFGAQFMARLMSYLHGTNTQQKLIILVATSGDTGGAVAAGFHRVPGIEVVILYPKNKVSALQEMQLTTLGDNITAMEIEGSFDDCQKLVKTCFRDDRLRQHLLLTSANSINISRLIPQSFYYFEGYRQVATYPEPIIYSVPSGNFGNLTAGLMARRMGLPIREFVAATNVNDVVPQYLLSGDYQPRASQPTLSNAMDVGDPSNFDRIQDLYGSTWNDIRQDIYGYSFTDAATEEAMIKVWSEDRYLLDPHGAVAYLGLKTHRQNHPFDKGIFMETAHPSKFKADVDRIINFDTPLHPTLAALVDKEPQKTMLPNDYSKLKSFLLDRFNR